MSTIGHLTVHFLYPKILLLGTNVENWIIVTNFPKICQKCWKIWIFAPKLWALFINVMEKRLVVDWLLVLYDSLVLLLLLLCSTLSWRLKMCWRLIDRPMLWWFKQNHAQTHSHSVSAWDCGMILLTRWSHINYQINVQYPVKMGLLIIDLLIFGYGFWVQFYGFEFRF